MSFKKKLDYIQDYIVYKAGSYEKVLNYVYELQNFFSKLESKDLIKILGVDLGKYIKDYLEV